MFKHKAVDWLERRKLGTMILSCGIGWQKPPLVQLELYQEHASNDLISSGKGLGLATLRLAKLDDKFATKAMLITPFSWSPLIQSSIWSFTTQEAASSPL